MRDGGELATVALLCEARGDDMTSEQEILVREWAQTARKVGAEFEAVGIEDLFARAEQAERELTAWRAETGAGRPEDAGAAIRNTREDLRQAEMERARLERELDAIRFNLSTVHLGELQTEKAAREVAEKEQDEARQECERLRRHAVEADEARERAEADNAAKDKAFSEYVEQYGVEHETRCPEDDTCDCEFVVALNKAFGPSHPGAALLEYVLALEAVRETAARVASEAHVGTSFDGLDGALRVVDALKVKP